jgi:hypothetical protein
MPKIALRSPARSEDSPRYNLSDWPFSRPTTKQETAEALSCTGRFLEQEVLKGRLRAIHLGTRSVRFLPSDIVAWLNARPVSTK